MTVEHVPPALAALLRGQRILRGWSLKQAVSELHKQAAAEGHTVAVNVHMLSTWESGRKQPSMLYRLLFAKVYGLPPAALGLPGAATFMVAAPVPDSLGMEWISEEGDESMKRRALFRHAAGITGALVMAPGRRALDIEPAGESQAGIEPSAVRGGRMDPEVLRGIEALTDRYRSLYYSVDPGALLGPVREHCQFSERLLGLVAAGYDRDRLCTSMATMALLAGRILFFDCSAPNQARGYYSLALEGAQEGGNDHLAAAALGHMSFVSASRAKPRAAVELLDEAHRRAERQPSPLVSSWLSAVEAEQRAKAGDHEASLGALEQATRRLEEPEIEPGPVWLDWFSPARLDGFAGYTHLGLERWADARSSLSRALSAEPSGSKQRSVFLADLASTYLHEGHLDKGCELARDALEAAARSGYDTGMRRVRELPGIMTPWSSAPVVKQFTEQLAHCDV